MHHPFLASARACVLGSSLVVLVAGCRDENPWDCTPKPGAPPELNYRFGDRCALGLSAEGDLVVAPPVLRLVPATDGMPSTGRITIIGYAERRTWVPSDMGAAGSTSEQVTPADGYFVDIALAEGCELPIELAPAPGAELCVVDTPTNLRCLLDSTGVTEIDVSTTLDYATAGDCEIEVKSGVKSADAEVHVTHDPGDLALAIHLGIADGSCGDPSNPCVANGGQLPQEVCTTGVGECANITAGASFYLATEKDGVQVPVAERTGVDLQVNAKQHPPGAFKLSMDPECSGQISYTSIAEAGDSPTSYMCTSGQAGEYELRATSIEGDLSDSVTIEFPPIPARLALVRLEGPSEGGEATDTDATSDTGDATQTGTTGDPMGPDDASAVIEYRIDVYDCEGQVIQEPLEVSTAAGQVFVVTSGTPFLLVDDSSTLTASFVDWTRSCSVAL